MMPDAELAGLAADIKDNGLIHPVVTDATGKIVIDGRNRLRACEIAGVEPNFEKLTGQDPAAFIVSANLNRRNLTKGQQAMALAMIYPEPSKGGRGKKAANPKETLGFSQMRLSQARSVFRHSRPLAEAVLAGTMKLDFALKKVDEDRDAASSADAKYTRLRTAAPDFADLVDDESMTVDEALAAMQQRESTNKVHRETGIYAAGAPGARPRDTKRAGLCPPSLLLVIIPASVSSHKAIFGFAHFGRPFAGRIGENVQKGGAFVLCHFGVNLDERGPERVRHNVCGVEHPLLPSPARRC